MKRVAVLALSFLLIAAFLFSSDRTLAEGTYSDPGTSDSADCSADCLTWSQAPPWVVDKYGKFILNTQNRTGPTTHFAFSNDNGSTWTQSADGYGFLTRASMAYDSIDDVLHLVWSATDANDGIIYRRYSITRDGSNNITSIQRMDLGVNLQLDTSASRSFDHPIAIWKDDGSAHGSLVAIWAKSGSNLAEVRASMRQLSMTDADGVAGNWVALDGTGDTFSTDPPAVEADKIYGSTTTGSAGVAAKIRGGEGAHKNDLYFFASVDISGGGTSAILAYRMVWSSGSSNWSGGTTSLGTVGQINQSGGGYSLKYQLISKPVIDTTNDRLYIAWPRWKDGGDGDTVSFAYLDSSDNISSVTDVYSALGTHSYAPAMDISYDNTGQLLYIAYITSTTNGANGSILYKTYDGSTLSSSTTFYTSPGGSAGEDGSADIPLMMDDRLSVNDRIYMTFRVNGALPPTGVDPHTVRIGYIQLSAPTPTPTPTPTPSPNTSSGLTTPSNQNIAAPSCTDSAPNGVPDLYQIDAAGTFVNLNFTTVPGAQGYQISYGINNDSNSFGDYYAYSGPGWVINRPIGSLMPNTSYSFKIKAVNGCNGSNWSKTVQVKTKSKFADLTQKFLSFNPLSVKSKPADCLYTVQSGDSLWKIATTYLGSGRKFSQLIAYNPEIFNSNISSVLRIGWKIKVC